MAYEVTATRKRPQAFEKLVGQEFVVSTIENAIESGRIAHAYLFSGPRGVGKTSSARLLAKALNCVHGPTAHPCGVCDSCREITAGSSVDVIEIDGASNTSVNDIRVIKDEVLFPPQSSRYKIYIIDEVHMLSNSAFNALLKTVEEPPEYIIFIFATTELQKVPATIRSRCQQFRFQLIGLDEIKGCLKEAADEMNIKADDDALFWIAREATGSMRDAYTLFDQVASFSGDHITLAGIKSKLGIAGTDAVASIVSLAVAGRRSEAIAELASILSSGISVEQCIRDFTQFFRSMLLASEGVESEEILSMRKEDIPQDIIRILSVNQLEAALRSLLQIYREIRYSISPRFELELFISRLSSLPFITTNEELVMKLNEMREDVKSGKVTVVKENVPVQIAVPEVKKKLEEPVVSANPPKRDEEQKIEHVAEAAYAEKEEDIDDIPDEYSNSESETEPEAVETKPLSACLEALKNELMRSDIWEVSNTVQFITSITENEGCAEIRVDNSLSLNNLKNNINEVRKALEMVSGFTGKTVILLQEKQQIKADSKLEHVARMFRGSVVFDNQQE